MLNELLNDIQMSAGTTFANLTLFPILGGDPGEPEYHTLNEALASGRFRVEERSERGIVGRLLAINQGDRPVLLVDGEEVEGMKQNRVVNLTLLVGAGTTVEVPVSCVERGRWDPSTRVAEPTDRNLFARARALKAASVTASLHHGAGRASDQTGIWDEIENKRVRLGVHSPTEAAADLYDHHRHTLGEYVAALPPVAGQCGACFTIDGRIVGLDLFHHQRTLAAYLPKLVRSYALDAVESCRPEPPAADRGAAEAFLARVVAAPVVRYPSPGLGHDLRLTSERLAGGALEVEGRLLHLCAFATRGGPTGGRMAPPSSRGRPWRIE